MKYFYREMSTWTVYRINSNGIVSLFSNSFQEWFPSNITVDQLKYNADEITLTQAKEICPNLF